MSAMVLFSSSALVCHSWRPRFRPRRVHTWCIMVRLFSNSLVLAAPKSKRLFCVTACRPFGMFLHSLVSVAPKSKLLLGFMWPRRFGALPYSLVLAAPKSKRSVCCLAWRSFGVPLYSLVLAAPKSKRLCCRFRPLVRGAFPFPFFPCVHRMWRWSTHSSTNFLPAGTLLLLWRVHKQFVRVFIRCSSCFAVSRRFSPTSPKSGAKIVGGFQRSENMIFPFFYLFAASFFCFSF